jgi:hypothetical protein
VLDGTLIAVGRVAEGQPSYSGKYKKNGMSLQVISSPLGDILRVPGPLPGSVHDLTAARIRGVIRQLAATGLITLAGKGYIGAGQHVLFRTRGRAQPTQTSAGRPARRLSLAMPGTATFTLRQRRRSLVRSWGPTSPTR